MNNGNQAPPDPVDAPLVGPDEKSKVDMKAQKPKEPLKFKLIK